MTDVPRVFLLSPASSAGERARLVTRPEARFPLALAVRSAAGAALGEVFSFTSGLYFRGKLHYATAFARPPAPVPGVLVITASRGLRPPQDRVTLDVLQEFAGVPIDAAEPRYAEPLRRDAELLATLLASHPTTQVVLLGSVASDKYVDVLGPVLGDRLMFPSDFVGRGDMSRGGLMLRAARERHELTYVPVAGAVRRGRRPPRGFGDVFPTSPR
ncbi:MAG TPA: hypothetical protein VGR62_16840 [Candidatus Binatia bacterium]|nr:hypothetical protein [Candidatus Binatia bacterium]